MSGKDKTDVETPEKRRHTEKQQIVELDGEYGYYKNDSFHSLSNFILKCEGVVEEDGVITGYMMRAKPKDNRDENVENWYLSIFLLFLVLKRPTSIFYMKLVKYIVDCRFWNVHNCTRL